MNPEPKPRDLGPEFPRDRLGAWPERDGGRPRGEADSEAQESAPDLLTEIFAVIDDAYLAETGYHIANRSWLSTLAGRLAEHTTSLLAAKDAEIERQVMARAAVEGQRDAMRQSAADVRLFLGIEEERGWVPAARNVVRNFQSVIGALQGERDEALAFAEEWREIGARLPRPAEWNALVHERDELKARVIGYQTFLDQVCEGIAGLGEPAPIDMGFMSLPQEIHDQAAEARSVCGTRDASSVGRSRTAVMAVADRSASYLSPPDLHRLDWACRPIFKAFGSPPYLVGSALTRPDFRDIDLRLILDDERCERLLDESEELRLLLNIALSGLIERTAGQRAPIDFQIQSMSEANVPEHGVRNPMGLRHG